MPIISVFSGLIVRMYFFNLKTQTKPHIHVAYAESSAIFGIEDAALLAGEIPLKQTRLIQAWIELRREELPAATHRGVRRSEARRAARRTGPRISGSHAI